MALRVGFIGWRGMVGSVLLERMRAQGDFVHLDPVFFSTSNPGGAPPDVGCEAPPLVDACKLDALAAMDAIVTCQGSGHTRAVHGPLRARGWDGYWIDASSALRLHPTSTLILDPVNRSVIDAALDSGGRDFCGPNCTVSVMLMGLAGLFEAGWIDWISTMTYQAASGAGAQGMRELIGQMQRVGQAASADLAQPTTSALRLDTVVNTTIRAEPAPYFGAPLAGSAIPWVGGSMPGGQSQEEFKGCAETNKILDANPAIPVDGVCVRIGAMRCHAQGLTIKLNTDVSLEEIEARLANAHPWVEVVPNTPEATRERLTLAATAGTLIVRVGRLRWLNLAPRLLGAFTVGDQLLWGAAEPLRRMLRILIERQASVERKARLLAVQSPPAGSAGCV
jgi:aspartate-semialdehyde dehydrogenase